MMLRKDNLFNNKNLFASYSEHFFPYTKKLKNPTAAFKRFQQLNNRNFQEALEAISGGDFDYCFYNFESEKTWSVLDDNLPAVKHVQQADLLPIVCLALITQAKTISHYFLHNLSKTFLQRHSAPLLFAAVLSGNIDNVKKIPGLTKQIELSPLVLVVAIMSQQVGMLRYIIKNAGEENCRELLMLPQYTFNILPSALLYGTPAIVEEVVKYIDKDILKNQEVDFSIAAKSGNLTMFDVVIKLASQYHCKLNVSVQTLEYAVGSGNVAVLDKVIKLASDYELNWKSEPVLQHLLLSACQTDEPEMVLAVTKIAADAGLALRLPANVLDHVALSHNPKMLKLIEGMAQDQGVSLHVSKATLENSFKEGNLFVYDLMKTHKNEVQQLLCDPSFVNSLELCKNRHVADHFMEIVKYSISSLNADQVVYNRRIP